MQEMENTNIEQQNVTQSQDVEQVNIQQEQQQEQSDVNTNQTDVSNTSNDVSNDTSSEDNSGAPEYSDRYLEIISNLGQSKIEEAFNSYDRLNQILNDPNEIAKLSKEEVINLINKKQELEQFINEVKPLIEEQKQRVVNEFKSKYDEPVVNAAFEIFGNDLSKEEIQVLDTLLSKIDSYYKSKYGSNQQQEQQPADMSNVSASKEPDITGNMNIAEMLKSSDPKIREQAIKLIDSYAEKIGI